MEKILSDLIGIQKNTTSAQAPREPIEYPSFPVEGYRVQHPADIAVDVAPESDLNSLYFHATPLESGTNLIDIPRELSHLRGDSVIT